MPCNYQHLYFAIVVAAASLQKQVQASEARAAGSEQAAGALQQDLASWQARYKRKDADLAAQHGKVAFPQKRLLACAPKKACVCACAPNKHMYETDCHVHAAAVGMVLTTLLLKVSSSQNVWPICWVRCYMSASVPRLTQADCVMFAARPPQQSPVNATCIYGILLHCNQMADMAIA